METARYTIGNKVPDRVLHPANEEEAAQLLLAARNAGEAVVPVGGATMLDIGDVPSHYVCAVVTDRMTGIVEYNPGDLTIVVRAGTTLAEVEAELHQHRQFLSLQAPFPERATIGGALAANVSGPLRLAYGSPRDAVIGTRVALPNGQVAKSGGRVVKNVAGYDLSKLFIGSFGTLGIIVEAAFKVFPQPLSRRVLVIPASGCLAAMELASSVARLGPGFLSLVAVNERLAGAMRLEGAIDCCSRRRYLRGNRRTNRGDLCSGATGTCPCPAGTGGRTRTGSITRFSRSRHGAGIGASAPSPRRRRGLFRGGSSLVPHHRHLIRVRSKVE